MHNLRHDILDEFAEAQQRARPPRYWLQPGFTIKRTRASRAAWFARYDKTPSRAAYKRAWMRKFLARQRAARIGWVDGRTRAGRALRSGHG